MLNKIMGSEGKGVWARLALLVIAVTAMLTLAACGNDTEQPNTAASDSEANAPSNLPDMSVSNSGTFAERTDLGVMLTVIRDTDGQVRFMVKSIEAGSLGETAGMMVGDILLTANGSVIPISEVLIGMEVPFIPNEALGNIFALRVSRGGEVWDLELRIN